MTRLHSQTIDARRTSVQIHRHWIAGHDVTIPCASHQKEDREKAWQTPAHAYFVAFNAQGKPLLSLPAEARNHPQLVTRSLTAVELLNSACIAREREQWVECGSYERNLACDVPLSGGSTAIAADPDAAVKRRLGALQQDCMKAHAAIVQHQVTGQDIFVRFKEAGAHFCAHSWSLSLPSHINVFLHLGGLSRCCCTCDQCLRMTVVMHPCIIICISVLVSMATSGHVQIDQMRFTVTFFIDICIVCCKLGQVQPLCSRAAVTGSSSKWLLDPKAYSARDWAALEESWSEAKNRKLVIHAANDR
jgi:hypothetical protein